MVEVVKSLGLNLLPLTQPKNDALYKLLTSYRSASNDLWDVLDFWEEIPNIPPKLTKYNLQHLVYHSIKRKYGFQAQHIVDLIKDVWACRDTSNRYIKNHIAFNIPRSAKFSETKRGNPIVVVTTLNCYKRIALPIRQDGGYKRFVEHLDNGFNTSHFQLIFNECWKIKITIKKNIEYNSFKTVLGIDVGVRTLAAITVLDGKKVLNQTYFGRDVTHTQRNICIRRSKLQSVNNKNALARLKDYESNFVKTRCYQVAHEIVRIAKKYNSCIAIENLTGLNSISGWRKLNRKIKRMPYHSFRVALETVARQNRIPVILVDPAYTSQTCPRCGNIKKQSGKIYTCTCGYIANRDRSASHNIAFRAEKIVIPSNFSQISEGRIASNPMSMFG